MPQSNNNLSLVGSQRMSPTQQRVFALFVGIGVGRSIPKLFEMCQELNVGVTLRMIKRWSSQFKWYEMAKTTQSQIAAEISEEIKPILRDLTLLDLKAMQTLKERFYARVLIDPSNLDLTPEEKARAIDPDLNDYVMIIKHERMILADPNENNPDAPKLGSKLQITDADIERALGRLVVAKYGLPEKNVTDTYEQNDDA